MKDIEKQRTNFLNHVKRIVELAHERHNINQYDLCPCPDDPTRLQALKHIGRIKKDIAALCGNLRDIEAESSHALGMVQLIGHHDVPDEVRVAVSLLISKALTSAVSVETVSDLCDLAGGREPAKLVAIRQSMAYGGILRPHVHVTAGRTTEEGRNPTLREDAVTSLLGLCKDVAQ